jgi:hypothetical protein
MIYVAVLQSAMMFGFIFGYVRQFVIKIQKPATSVVTVVSSLSCLWCCTPRDLPLVCNYANQAKGAPPFKIGCHGLEPLNTCLFCTIQVVTYSSFSKCFQLAYLLSLVSFACAPTVTAASNGPRQFSQTYGFIAPHASEESVSRTVKRTKNLQQPQQQPLSHSRSGGGGGGRLLLQARTNIATVLIEAFAHKLH